MRQYLLGVLTGVFLGIAASNVWGMGAPRIYHKYAPTVVQVMTENGSGTGVIVNRSGDVLTNAHVVEELDAEVRIITYPGDALYEAKVIKIDKVKDLALLDIKGHSLNWKHVRIKKVNVYVGQDVYSIGHPLGRDWSISNGIISAKQRFYYGSYRTQSTVITNPGSSGSPLFDRKGNLIGLVRGLVIATPFSGFSGISIAVTLDDIIDFMTIKPRYKLGDLK